MPLILMAFMSSVSDVDQATMDALAVTIPIFSPSRETLRTVASIGAVKTAAELKEQVLGATTVFGSFDAGNRCRFIIVGRVATDTDRTDDFIAVHDTVCTSRTRFTVRTATISAFLKTVW